MTFPVYADVVRPASRVEGRLFDVLTTAGFSLLIGLAAQVAVPLPFTPVPLTVQTLAVLATGALLGRTRGLLAVALYVAEGCAGLPVFSGGRAGIAHLLGPTGGYLAGFLAAAWLAGMFAESGWDRRWITAFAALVIADAAVFVPGVLWLGAFTGYSRVLILGALPFAAADLVKAALCAALLPAGWRLLQRR
jgi:biotin transport system substrate-specific component